APMERIIAVDLARAGDRFGEIAESQKPATGGQMLAEAGVFGEHRPAAGEIGGAAVAEPAGVKLPVERLRAAELGARALDVFAILRRRARHPVGRCQTPAGALQKLAVAGMNVGGKLERAAGLLRHVEIFQIGAALGKTQKLLLVPVLVPGPLGD